MTRSLLVLGLLFASATAMSEAAARDVARLSAADAANCPADLAAAKAEAEPKPEATTAVRATKPATSTPVRAQAGLRGGDPAPASTRLSAPRWHSFLPGMFR